MKIRSISDYVFYNSQRSSASDIQKALIEAGYEASTGRVFDPGLSLGGRTGNFVNNDNQLSELDNLKTLIALTEGRMSALQAAINSLISVGDKDNADGTLTAFNKMLFAGSTDVTRETIQKGAQSALDAFLSAINTQFNGDYVFGGTNQSAPPLKHYKANQDIQVPLTEADGKTLRAPNNAQEAVADAFYKEFGFGMHDKDSTGNPKAAGISKEAMEKFINGRFDNLFKDPAWSKYFSNAKDGELNKRISEHGELVDVSVSANEKGVRDAMKNLIMVAEFSNMGLKNDAQDVLLDDARSNADKSSAHSTITELISLASRLGSVEQRVKNAQGRVESKLGILQKLRTAYIGIDTQEAASRLTQLQNMLQVSYEVTSHLSKLSLLNFLR